VNFFPLLSRPGRCTTTWPVVAPDGTGTTLTLAYEHSSKIPLVGQGLDKVMWNGDKDLETMLAADKEAVEA